MNTLKQKEQSTKRMLFSGVASTGARGQSAPLTAKNLPKTGKNSEKEGENQEKSGRKGKNQEGSFTLPLLTDASNAFAFHVQLPGTFTTICDPTPANEAFCGKINS